MTISYKWLSEYLPEKIEPETLSKILTAIGLEVESMETYEVFKGGLKGLVVGEVLQCEKHPNADKLRLTKVNIGNAEPLSIVCGAPNVAAGQKVIVAPVGTTIYPAGHDPITMKLAKIRGEESQGMICAEDEIGMGTSHEGIMVLPAETTPGTPASEYFNAYEDIIYEIGLTPNRMDAMSHWGVARDVCAYLSFHDKKEVRPVLPQVSDFTSPALIAPLLTVSVENTAACPRYSGICISNVTIQESPQWLQNRLKAIGLRPINNLVDITNFIQHETGQPLHAFDADQIKGGKVIVKNLPEGTPFITLDEKERKLSAEDLMICDETDGMCIAGVFGGLHSGVTLQTKNIFLESACFNPITIRKTSFRHGLRTDAATRFEKGTDISVTANVLKRTAQLVLEICGGQISSDIIDIYADPQPKKQVKFTYSFLQKLSGKAYNPADVHAILKGLGFEILQEENGELLLSVPYHKTDISQPADIVEEIVRIDGLDNIEIPTKITITPAVDENLATETFREKIANYLCSIGYNEILTNSITNKAYFTEAQLTFTVKMKNSLSAELNVLRPRMLETALEVLSHNLNRKNENLKLFEFGRTYAVGQDGFQETDHLCLYLSGKKTADTWKTKATNSDIHTLKGALDKIFSLLGITYTVAEIEQDPVLGYGIIYKNNEQTLASAGSVHKKLLSHFDIRQDVLYADICLKTCLELAAQHKPVFTPIPRFPAVQRDIAIVVSKQLKYQQVENVVNTLRLKKLQSMQLFDIFESEKLGVDKKSIAINFTFLDAEKTLTDAEIDGWMNKVIQRLEKELQAEVRK
ncbi:MAG: phenylalanine--tRNA ligase subunit beta [Niabella sp.]